jgi:hypothetical protein
MSQILPRFLLPRISWQAGPGQHSLRTISTVAATQIYPRSFTDHHGVHIPSRTSFHEPQERKSRVIECLPHRRVFHATASRPRDHHFDTLKFVERLKGEGFTEEQSVAMMKVLSDVIEERCEVFPSAF